MPEKEKKNLADYTILNNYSIDNLYKKIDELFNKLIT